MKYTVVIDFDTMETVTVKTQEEAYKIAIEKMDEYDLSRISKSEMLEIATFFTCGGDLVIDGIEIRAVWG